MMSQRLRLKVIRKYYLCFRGIKFSTSSISTIYHLRNNVFCRMFDVISKHIDKKNWNALFQMGNVPSTYGRPLDGWFLRINTAKKRLPLSISPRYVVEPVQRTLHRHQKSLT